MEGKTPYVVVLVIQSIYAGMFMVSKVAFDVGMNPFVFVFYRQAAATLFLAPIALFFLKRNIAPPFSFLICFKIFMVSLIGITLSLSIYGVALKYTSATLAAATSNSIPVITFILAVLLGSSIYQSWGLLNQWWWSTKPSLEERQEGRPVRVPEIFKKRHIYRNKKGEEVWVEDRAKELYEKATAVYEERIASQASECGSSTPAQMTLEEETALWLEVNGGVKKGSAYGLGSQYASERLNPGLFGNYTPPASSINPSVETSLRNEIEELKRKSEEERLRNEENMRVMREMMQNIMCGGADKGTKGKGKGKSKSKSKSRGKGKSKRQYSSESGSESSSESSSEEKE